MTQPDRVSTANRINPDGTVAKPVAAGPNVAKELVGKYTGPQGGTVEIMESEGNVTFNIGGQQPYTLTEKEKDNYAMSPLPDAYSLKAKRDAAGKVISVVVTQPEGAFEFKLAAPDASPKITVDELHQKVIDATGGEANLRKIKTRVTEADIDLENQGVQAVSRSYAKAPNKEASETTFTALGKTIGTQWHFFDGNGGEDSVSFAPTDKYSGKRLEDIRIEADLYGLLNWKTNYKKVEVTGIAKVDGEDAYKIFFAPEKGSGFTEYYSTKTYLLLRRDGVIASSTSDQQIPFTVLYSDYRDVDGIKMPFKTINSNIAYGNIVTTVKSVKHNVPLDDKIFAPRKVK